MSSDSLVLSLLRAEFPDVTFVAEFKFHPTRKWRFDFACEECKLAIEQDGAIWTYGRHNRASSLLKDYEKFNTAASMGWRVLHFTPQQIMTNEAMELVAEALKVGRKLPIERYMEI